jgi:hypothetical protein
VADQIEGELHGVRTILALWDPIGVIDLLEEEGLPPAEYDPYAPAILTMLRRGTTRGEIVQHLGQIQKCFMGLKPSRDHDGWIADRLLEWWRARHDRASEAARPQADD